MGVYREKYSRFAQKCSKFSPNGLNLAWKERFEVKNNLQLQIIALEGYYLLKN